MLERQALPERPFDPDEPEAIPQTDQSEGDASADARGRGAAAKSRAAEARKAKRIKGRTIYLPDDLFERILVQAHRRGRTISEYVAAVMDRSIPDHRAKARPETPEAPTTV